MQAFEYIFWKEEDRKYVIHPSVFLQSSILIVVNRRTGSRRRGRYIYPPLPTDKHRIQGRFMDSYIRNLNRGQDQTLSSFVLWKEEAREHVTTVRAFLDRSPAIVDEQSLDIE